MLQSDCFNSCAYYRMFPVMHSIGMWLPTTPFRYQMVLCMQSTNNVPLLLYSSSQCFFSSLSYIPLFARSLKHKNGKCTRNYLLVLLIHIFYLFTATGFGERSNSKRGSLPGRATFWRIHRILSCTSMFPQEISQKGNTIQCVSNLYALMVRTHVQYKCRSNYCLDLGGRGS
jgi:hypothetical protein